MEHTLDTHPHSAPRQNQHAHRAWTGGGGGYIGTSPNTQPHSCVNTPGNTAETHISTPTDTHTSPLLWTAHTSKLAKGTQTNTPPCTGHPQSFTRQHIHVHKPAYTGNPSQARGPKHSCHPTPGLTTMPAPSAVFPGMRIGSQSDWGTLLPHHLAGLAVSPPPLRPAPAGCYPSCAPNRAQSP